MKIYYKEKAREYFRTLIAYLIAIFVTAKVFNLATIISSGEFIILCILIVIIDWLIFGIFEYLFISKNRNIVMKAVKEEANIPLYFLFVPMVIEVVIHIFFIFVVGEVFENVVTFISIWSVVLVGFIIMIIRSLLGTIMRLLTKEGEVK